MTSPLDTLTRIASRILCTTENALDPDTPLHELGFDDIEWRDMLEEACDIHGVPLIDLINTMPVYRFKCSDTTLASLIDLAAFSRSAATLLSESTTQIHLDTLRSLAHSLEEGRYVPSGLKSENLHQPNTPLWVSAKVGFLGLFAFGLPMLNAYGPCNPICRDCLAAPSVKFWEIGGFSLPVFAAIVAFGVGPGLYEMWYNRQKQRKRARATT